MTYVLTVALFKGGTGKTTTALMIGSVLRAKGYRVLYVDFDGQSCLTRSLGLSPVQPSAFELLTDPETPINKVIKETDRGDVVPAVRLMDNVIIYMDRYKKSEQHTVFRSKLAALKRSKKYDFIIIDTPGQGTTPLILNALTASDGVVLIGESDGGAYWSMSDTYALIGEAREINKKLTVLGVLLTRFNPRLNLSKAMYDAIEAYAAKMGTHVFKTTIRESVAMKESRITKSDPVTDNPKSPAVADYVALVDELLNDKGVKP